MSIDSCTTVVELLQGKKPWECIAFVRYMQKTEEPTNETVLHRETLVYRICSKVATPSIKLGSIWITVKCKCFFLKLFSFVFLFNLSSVANGYELGIFFNRWPFQKERAKPFLTACIDKKNIRGKKNQVTNSNTLTNTDKLIRQVECEAAAKCSFHSFCS